MTHPIAYPVCIQQHPDIKGFVNLHAESMSRAKDMLMLMLILMLTALG